MSSSTISFVIWTGLMLLALAVLVVKARKSRGLQNKTEDIASRALPEIGEVAEKKHHQRFGRASTNAPGEKHSWYPEVKKKAAKQA